MSRQCDEQDGGHHGGHEDYGCQAIPDRSILRSDPQDATELVGRAPHTMPNEVVEPAPQRYVLGTDGANV
jgi:hypothetical protein